MISKFDESKHPRKKDGKFAPKGNSEQRTKELERKYNDDFENKPKSYKKTKDLTSKVMCLYSSNRKAISKYGRVKTQIYTFDYVYTVEIIGFSGDYKILNRRKIK